ncbi:hypothetical protein GWI33_017272 [Rhynchophorus ferrugineus]|uniref:Uncharacterized protein n=1 Tax=Rhynchophorus ferrugineus TaxID=354439 RepID=A0A834M7T6_RHYFE|nr:hypothetical protein GWI33_017272 [Rhynchophorus ferrugineus]
MTTKKLRKTIFADEKNNSHQDNAPTYKLEKTTKSLLQSPLYSPDLPPPKGLFVGLPDTTTITIISVNLLNITNPPILIHSLVVSDVGYGAATSQRNRARPTRTTTGFKKYGTTAKSIAGAWASQKTVFVTWDWFCRRVNCLSVFVYNIFCKLSLNQPK